MLRRPSSGTEISSACAGAIASPSTLSGSCCVMDIGLADGSMVPVAIASSEPSAIARLNSLLAWLDEDSADFFPNRFLRTDMVRAFCLSADAQKLGLLRKRLQVDLLPVSAVGIGIAAAKVRRRALRGL